uniref:CRAL-TRIO domain-containing protein n=1 Tax=Fibrocapsa japonica TaxID=94617 RepID=A0A7S2V3E4_9STRA
MRNMLKWREEFGVDEIREDIVKNRRWHPRQFPKGEQVLPVAKGILAAQGLQDCKGQPVSIEAYDFSPQDMLQHLDVDEVVRFHLYCMEYKMVLLEHLSNELEADKARRGLCREDGWGEVLQVFIIRDLGGFNTEHLGPVGRDTSSRIVQVSQANYPNVMYCCCLINTPFLFRAFWKLIKPLLPTHTTRKIHFYGKSFVQDLSKFIEPETLPASLGGGNAQLDWTARTPLDGLDEPNFTYVEEAGYRSWSDIPAAPIVPPCSRADSGGDKRRSKLGRPPRPMHNKENKWQHSPASGRAAQHKLLDSVSSRNSCGGEDCNSDSQAEFESEGEELFRDRRSLASISRKSWPSLVEEGSDMADQRSSCTSQSSLGFTHDPQNPQLTKPWLLNSVNSTSAYTSSAPLPPISNGASIPPSPPLHSNMSTPPKRPPRRSSPGSSPLNPSSPTSGHLDSAQPTSVQPGIEHVHDNSPTAPVHPGLKLPPELEGGGQSDDSTGGYEMSSVEDSGGEDNCESEEDVVDMKGAVQQPGTTSESMSRFGRAKAWIVSSSPSSNYRKSFKDVKKKFKSKMPL